MREIKTANILLWRLNEYPNDTRLIIEVKIATYMAYFVKIDKETLRLNIFNLWLITPENSKANVINSDIKENITI